MQSEDITDAAHLGGIAPSSQNPRRSTVSAMQTQGPTRLRANNSQCTHMTVTRLYTKDFRCSICLRVAPLGWLYRCTQDRELLLYDDMERGCQDKFDKLSDLFELPSCPPKRHPVTRLDRLSFLDEITDEQLKTYRKEQLNLILKQRAQVLDTASEPDLLSDTNPFSSKSYYNIPLNNSVASLASPSPPPKVTERPWLPLKGGECQFKCCHFCRQNMHERAYLSLNGVADGDVPVTAILGFGFHLSKKRPVALVKHVKKLGLRPSPSPTTGTSSGITAAAEMTYKKLPTTLNTLSTFISRRNTSQGLGIFAAAIPFSRLVPDPKYPSKTADMSNNNSVEHGFTALPMSAPLPLDPTPTKELSKPASTVRDLKYTFQHHTSVEDFVPSKEDVNHEAASPMPPTADGVEARVLTGLGFGLNVADKENEKEALAELDVKENDEPCSVLDVAAVGSEVDIADVIT